MRMLCVVSAAAVGRRRTRAARACSASVRARSENLEEDELRAMELDQDDNS
jgi:hypothetical protein